MLPDVARVSPPSAESQLASSWSKLALANLVPPDSEVMLYVPVESGPPPGTTISAVRAVRFLGTMLDLRNWQVFGWSVMSRTMLGLPWLNWKTPNTASWGANVAPFTAPDTAVFVSPHPASRPITTTVASIWVFIWLG